MLSVFFSFTSPANVFAIIRSRSANPASAAAGLATITKSKIRGHSVSRLLTDSLKRRLILFLITALPVFLPTESPSLLNSSSLGKAYITRYLEENLRPVSKIRLKSPFFTREQYPFLRVKRPVFSVPFFFSS